MVNFLSVKLYWVKVYIKILYCSTNLNMTHSKWLVKFPLSNFKLKRLSWLWTHIDLKMICPTLLWNKFIDNLFNITNTVMSQGQKSRKYVTRQFLSRPFLTVNSVVFCPTCKVLEHISMLVMIWIAWIKEHHIHPCQSLPSI